MRFCMALVLLAAVASGGMAATITNPNPADTGVTLAQNPNNTFTSNAFTPGAGVTYANGYNVLIDPGQSGTYTYPSSDFYSHGGELCDMMALYFTIGGGYAYFAVVTNASPYGTPWDG